MTLYAPTARFDITRGMTEDEIRKIAPAIFATEAHESRSDRFVPVPTIEVLRGLKKEGFDVVGVKQNHTRDASKRLFTKHLIRLRRIDNQKYKVGDTVAEMLLKNANDGTSCYELMAGLFRILCLNSMVAHKADIETVKVRHNGRGVIDNVIEGTFRVLDEAEAALAAPTDWSKITLKEDEKMAFAESAHMIRFGEAEEGVGTVIQPRQLLAPRRIDDRGDDLWRVFNVTQEHLIRGGDRGTVIGENGQRRRTSTRAVNGIDQDVRLNRALWSLAEKMAEIKKAA